MAKLGSLLQLLDSIAFSLLDLVQLGYIRALALAELLTDLSNLVQAALDLADL